MRVDHLVVEDFRNYRSARVDFAPGVNLVVGRNAQGKTNLLEAVHCLAGTGSPRSADAALVRDGAERALLHAQVARAPRAPDQPARSMSVDIEIRPGRGTRALINKTPVSGGGALGALIASVFFGPDELSLVKGSPDGRRRFLDDLVVKLRPARDGLRREWERVLRQRNALLRTAPRSKATSLPTLDVWDDSLARAGGGLAAARLEVLGALLPYALKRYESIAGTGRLDLAYVSSWIDTEVTERALRDPSSVDEAELTQMLSQGIDQIRPRELERGMSLIGPQRDDVSVLLQAEASMLDARTYASQGDQRTSALALKLGEHDLLSERLDDQPLLLLDDVFSELDPARRAWLGDAVKSMGQILVSSAEPGAAEATRAERVFEISGGTIEGRSGGGLG
ncbi:MAG: DNA replication and repair protein RecF [Actinomycetota bacterium]|nr:DNA replication and repair protein RecF [Actinomycetota bacterium]